MPDYQRGAVYALTAGEDGAPFYVGSTTTKLPYRFDVHKCYAARFPNRAVYQRFAQVGIDNVRIRLLAAYPCNSKAELLAEERRHILAHATHIHGCNQSIAGGRPGSEYERTREHHTRYQRERYQRLKLEREAAAAE